MCRAQGADGFRGLSTRFADGCARMGGAVVRFGGRTRWRLTMRPTGLASGVYQDRQDWAIFDDGNDRPHL